MNNNKTEFNINDIRPDHLLKGQEESVQADIKSLLSHKDDFIKVNCPACDADNAEFVFQKTEIDYVVCNECATMYVNPRPTPEILEIFYTNSVNYAYWNKYIFPASEETRREKIFRPRAELVAEFIEQYGTTEKSLLEIGAGYGTFCEEAKNLGIFDKIYAVEPTPGLAETCRKRGLDVIEKTIENVDEVEKVGVVASFETLEHISSPRNFIEQSARLLDKDGLLIIYCPSGQGFDVVVMQEVSGTVDHEHLNYFNPGSLSHLVSNCGFEVLEVRTPGKLDAELVRNKVLAGEFELKEPFLQQVLIDNWDEVGESFQDFLAQNKLSSHMWLVARKLG